ncbi:MAG TPA: hypothetical protein VMH27_07125 [Puia sp.]|nr:hypothetical protein [Puia sp.]
MKRTLLLLAIAIGAALTGHAQTRDSTAKSPADSTGDPGYSSARGKTTASPTQRAARQLTTLQKKLNLNQDQVIKLRMILLNLDVSLDSLRSNPSGDKKSDNRARRAVTQDADGKIYALLTTDQQVAYAKWKQEQQLKRQLGRAAKNGPAADSSGKHP